MTALAGIWRLDRRPDAAECCRRMLVSQEIYGPHAGAQWANGNIALGRRLMRVLPEDAFDRQPLIGGGGRYVLVADLRLDNRDDLIDALHLPAEKAVRMCDAEILLAAVERWGDDFLTRIVGDYAFALWDGSHRRLTLARDPLGQRPLHYHRGHGFFAFASMPKGLHALAEVPYALNEDSIAKFLALLPIRGQSHFEGVQRVQTGHFVVVTESGITASRHWQPQWRRLSLRGPDEYAEALREKLEQAVHARLRGVGDVGAHLSGGLDSSAVAATAARLLKSSGRRVVAFTAVPREGYAGPAPRGRIIDEGPAAASIAALYPNMEHVIVRNEGRSPIDQLDRSFFLYDEPIYNLDILGWPQKINELARARKLTVLLSGGMGNIGLSHDGEDLFPELLRTGRWLRLWREAKLFTARSDASYRTVLARTFGPWCPPWLWLWLHRLRGKSQVDALAYSAILPRRYAEIDAVAHDGVDLTNRPLKDGASARFQFLCRTDRGNYQKGVLGGWQIDHRDPTADVRLLEFCLAVPPEQFFAGGRSKALARLALADRLPGSVLDEPRRGLQGADWHEWLTADRHRVAAEIERLEACAPAVRAIDLPKMRRLVQDWPQSGWETPEIGASYHWALLRGISTGYFIRRTTGANF